MCHSVPKSLQKGVCGARAVCANVYLRVCVLVPCTLHAFTGARLPLCGTSSLGQAWGAFQNAGAGGGPSFLMLLANFFPPPSWGWEPPKFSDLQDLRGKLESKIIK